MWYAARGALLAAVVLSLALKAPNLGIGSPHVTIDDITAYDGGFLVWFGNAPPQRMYLESWVIGASSLATYAGRQAQAGHLGDLGKNLVADAYRDFHNQPDAYVRNYRALMLAVDLATAALVFLLGRALAGDRRHWLPHAATALYLLSYNTVWCNLVARPDTLTAFFAVLGLLGYYRSDFGARQRPFLLGALALGLSAGMKLHGALFTIFIVLDLVRHHGLRRGIASALPFALLALAVFAVAAGTPLFDPLKYVKLRMLNIEDDKSPWLKWGDQVVTAMRGAGWLFPVLVAWFVVDAWRGRRRPGAAAASSLALLAGCWLLLFLGTRQLRAYWMLPALPLFYLAGLSALGSARLPRLVAPAVFAALVLVMGWQSVDQTQALRGARYGELRAWVRSNIAPAEPFFIFGYGALDVPLNTRCMARLRAGLERGLEADLEAGTPHVERHLKNWEEESALALMDLLGYRNDPGFEYYTFYGAPLDRFAGIIDLNEMRYILVQEGFENPPGFPLQSYLAENFERVADGLTGNGGGRDGLHWQAYRRRIANAG